MRLKYLRMAISVEDPFYSGYKIAVLLDKEAILKS
jgi:hypothetical protein